MLVVHNTAGSGDRIGAIEAKPFRNFAFGSLLAFADAVYERLFQHKLLDCSCLALPSGASFYDRAALHGISSDEKFDSVMCHVVMDHGAVLTDDFVAELSEKFLKPGGRLLNPVKSIAKDEVARVSRFGLETESAPCVVKKNDNFNLPETVLRMFSQSELDAWRARTSSDEQSRFVVHKLLRYFASEESGMHQLERWVVVFGDLTVNHRCSDEFYVKNATSLSYHVRDERRMKDDLAQFSRTGYNWKGRSIDCAYDNDAAAWDARYAVLEHFREAFRFDYAELDVMQPSKNEFVVIDVNQTPGPPYRNVYLREVAVRVLAEGLGITRKTPQADVEGAKPHVLARQELPREVKALEEELARNPANESVYFYLGEAHREQGEFESALAAYKQRAALEKGSKEERFLAQLEVGRISIRLEAGEAVVLSELLGAYMLGSLRAEPLYELACYFRTRKNYAMATLFAKAGVRASLPEGEAGVDRSVYAWRMLDELGVAAYFAKDARRAVSAWETILTRVHEGLTIPAEDLKRIQENVELARVGS